MVIPNFILYFIADLVANRGVYYHYKLFTLRFGVGFRFG